MLKESRQSRILEILEQQGNLTVADLCAQFGVSEMTIRRDLRKLDQQGLLRRVHGGAVSDLGRGYEIPYLARSTRSVEAKQAIGRRAAEMIVDGDSIGLDVGSTTLEIGRALSHANNLTLVTASLPIANEILANPALKNTVRLILTGGIVRQNELSMIGHIALRTYQDLHVDKAFIGVAGLTLEEGLTEYNLEDTMIKKMLLAHARHKIVVVDGSKFGQVHLATVGPLSSIDTVITDPAAPPDMVAAIRDLGIEVILAD